MEELNIDLLIEDGEIDIELDLDTKYFSVYDKIYNSDTIELINDNNFTSKTIKPLTFVNKTINYIDLKKVESIGSHAFVKTNFKQKVVSFPSVTKFLGDYNSELGNYGNGSNFDSCTINTLVLDSLKTLSSYQNFNSSNTIKTLSLSSLESVYNNAFNSDITNIWAPRLRKYYYENFDYCYNSGSTKTNFVFAENFANSLLNCSTQSSFLLNGNFQFREIISLPNIVRTDINSSSLIPTPSMCIGLLNYTSGFVKTKRLFVPRLELIHGPINGATQQSCLIKCYTSNSNNKNNITIALPSFKRAENASLIYSGQNYSFTLYLPKLELLNTAITSINNSYNLDAYNLVIGDSQSTDVPVLEKGFCWFSGYLLTKELNIYVPDHLIDDYKNAPNWCVVADYIKPQSDMTDELWDDINEQLKHPEPPDNYIKALEEIGVDYYKELREVAVEDFDEYYEYYKHHYEKDDDTNTTDEVMS